MKFADIQAAILNSREPEEISKLLIKGIKAIDRAEPMRFEKYIKTLSGLFNAIDGAYILNLKEVEAAKIQWNLEYLSMNEQDLEENMRWKNNELCESIQKGLVDRKRWEDLLEEEIQLLQQQLQKVLEVKNHE